MKSVGYFYNINGKTIFMKKENQSIQEMALAFVNTRSQSDFAKVYHRLLPGIHSYLRELVPDYDDRNEVVATTFAKVWSKIDQYDPYWNFSTWVYRIARNEALLLFRSRRKMNSYENMAERGVNMDVISGVCYQAGSEEIDPIDHLFDMALEEIENLPETYRTVLTLREVQKKKYDEIADELGWNQNTVRTRIRKARELVRAGLAERDPEIVKKFKMNL